MKQQFNTHFLLQLAASLFLISLTLTTSADSGDLDPSFAGTGFQRIRFGFGDDFGQALAVQPDGKVLATGRCTIDFIGGAKLAVIRLDTNNNLDLTFGNRGKAIMPLSLDTNADVSASAIALQPDGKIIIAGALSSGFAESALLVRLNPDGSLDTTFGQQGIATNNFGTTAFANAVVLQPDGKIVIGGFTQTPRFGAGFAIARYTTNGVLDTTFNGTGMTTDDNDGSVNGLALQADGKILAVGDPLGPGHNEDLGLFRYTTNGVLDTTFGSLHTGKVFTHFGTDTQDSFGTSVAIEPGATPAGDKIVIGGYSEAFNPPEFVFARFGLDGLPDNSFATGGVGTVFVGGGAFNITTTLLVQGAAGQPHKIILCGTQADPGFANFCTVRLNDNGSVDNFFSGGAVFTSFGSTDDRAMSASIVPGDKLLVLGQTLVSQDNRDNHDFAFARYNLSDGSLDNTFNGTGKMTVDVEERPASAKAAAVQSDGKVVVVGKTQNQLNFVDSLALARFDTNGLLDSSFGIAGKVTVTFTNADSEINAVAIQPDGKIIAAGDSDTNFLVARFNSDGTLDPTFNGTGIATTTFGQSGNVINSIALQPDGKIVLAGKDQSDVNFVVLRYNTNGLLDNSFAGTGRITVAPDVFENEASSVQLQADGKMIVSGFSIINGTTVDFTAVRIRTNGVVDSSFGTFGVLATQIGAPGCVGTCLALQPDGRFLIGGYEATNNNIDFALARYNTNGFLDASFNGTGTLTKPIGLGQDMASALGLQKDGKILLAGNAIIVGHPKFVVVRFQNNGVLDSAYGINGEAFADFDSGGDDTLNGMTLDSSDRPIIIGNSADFFTVARLQADPRLQILSINRLNNGHVLLTGTGAPDNNYTVQSSSALSPATFLPLGQATTDAAGFWQYEDTTSGNSSQRFYRLAFP